MIAVAFLQNPYFPEGTPQETIDAYRYDQEAHRVALLKSMSGKRLKKAFGDYFDQIHWDNANPAHGEKPSDRLPPDLNHMEAVIRLHSPAIVLCFSRTAEAGMNELVMTMRTDCAFAYCPHPNARGITNKELSDFAQRIINAYLV